MKNPRQCSRLRFVYAGFTFCIVSLFLGAKLGLADTESTFPLATNLVQLRQLASSGARSLCSFRLEGVVCSVKAEAGWMVLQDDSGAELLELNLEGPRADAGDRIRLEGWRCSVVFDGQSLRIGRAPVVDNDGIHPMIPRAGAVYLTPGRHPLRLLWFNAYGRYGLDVKVEGPGLERQHVPDSRLFRPLVDSVVGTTNFTNGLNYDVYEGAWLNLSSAFGSSKPVKSGSVSNFDLTVRSRDEHVGLEFSGLFEVAREGLYRFEMQSDDGSLLYVGADKVHCERLGEAVVPAARALVPGQSLDECEQGQWSQLEGVVTFASQQSRGLELELRAEPGRVSVWIAEGTGLAPSGLLHRRIRAAGIARSVRTLEGGRVLGRLSVLGDADLSVIEPAPGGTADLPLLTTADEVKRLARSEALRGYPVRLRGVITRAVRGYDSLVIQDETRGVFVGGVPARNAAMPKFGEFWEIEGVTAPGNFAPVVQWRSGRRLGPGRLPEPVLATWEELMNGSLDTQYVEILGVALGVGTNWLELLLPQGKINLGILDLEPGKLAGLENCLVRVRGCLFPAWDARTHRLNLGQLNLSSAAFSIEQPAPKDLFSVPATRPADLLLYNPSAAAFQRVKVAGQLLGSWQGLGFVNDGTNGIRFESRQMSTLRPGDQIEVVGFPELGGPSPLLREAVVRAVGHSALPEAQPLKPEDWLSSRHEATRVSVDGVLVYWRAEPEEQIIEIQSGWRNLVARMSAAAPLPGQPPLGSQVRLSGVYMAQGGSLSPGKGIDSFELLLDSAADLQVLARPPWMTLPRVLAALLVVALILLAAMFWALSLRRRVAAQTAVIRQKAQREAALEERARIAKDIHDDVGSNLTFIAMLGERSLEDLARPRELAAHTEKIVAYARATIQALDEIVWAINPQNDTLDALVGYVSQYASQCFENTGVRCRLHVPETLSPRLVLSETRHHLFLVVKEALNNSLKHSRASEITITASEPSGVLEIVIADNGVGFDPAAVRAGGGDGLQNMRERMAQIGGEFFLASAPGKGTSVRLTLRFGPTGR